MAKTKIHGEYLDASVISGQTQVTAVGADSVLIFDATDNALKKALLSDVIETVADGDITSAKLDTNIDIAGTFDVTGATTLDSTLNVAGIVGIGNTIASSFNSNSNNLVVGSGSGGEGITIYSANDNNAQIFFADGTSGDAAYRGVFRYAHDVDRFEFFTAGALKAVLDSSGNLGIASSDPTTLLTTFGSGTGGVAIAKSQPAIVFHDTDDNAYKSYLGQAATNTYLGYIGGGDLIIQGSTSATEKMRITSDGKVGIGTTSPSHTLHVHSDDAKGFLFERDSGSNAANLNEMSTHYSLSILNRTGGSYLNFAGTSAHTVLQATDSASSATAKHICANPYGGDFLVSTLTAVGSFYNGVSGIGFGYSSGGYGAFVRAGTAQPLYVSTNGQGSGGFIEFSQNGAQRGIISYDGSNMVYGGTSDYRLKKNVTPIENALTKIAALNPINFDWIESGENHDGFLAHEAQTVIPYAVTGVKDEVATDENSPEEKANGEPLYQMMEYGKLTPLLVKAVQEQQTIIDDLKARIEALES